MLLASLYDLKQFAVFSPDELDWRVLPPKCIVQTHWRPDERFLELLNVAGFASVTLARHPLDVLLSILQFAPREPRTARWLLGEGGSEAGIVNKTPNSEEFRRYVTGDRASALLSVSAVWWQRDEVLKVRYENLLSDPAGALSAVSVAIGPFEVPLEQSLNTLTLETLRRTTNNGHFWQGKAGLWKHLCPRSVANEAFAHHRKIFDTLGYARDCDENMPGNEDVTHLWVEMQRL
ncbi:MAG: sulfotransferase [Aromatoleum sp.]|nr:sulfotransferase [Aromatoleum sp.]